jgi:hypothetical protein
MSKIYLVVLSFVLFPVFSYAKLAAVVCADKANTAEEAVLLLNKKVNAPYLKIEVRNGTEEEWSFNSKALKSFQVIQVDGMNQACGLVEKL